VDHFLSVSTSCRSCSGRYARERLQSGEVPGNIGAASPRSGGADPSVRRCCMDSERRAATLRSRNVLPGNRSIANGQLLYFRFRSFRRMAFARMVLVAVATDTSGARLICAAIVVDLGISQLVHLGLRSMKRSLPNPSLNRTPAGGLSPARRSPVSLLR
jgi:hypothetical protein